MAPHSSTLAWKIPWTEEPGGLLSMGSLRVRHDWVTSLSLFTFHFHALEKDMTTHSSVLDWKIPWVEELGRLLSMGSQSPPGGRNSWYAVHKHVDSRQVRIRNLMMLTHNYLTTNPSEEYPWADHPHRAPLSHLVFKNLSLKSFGVFGSFKH